MLKRILSLLLLVSLSVPFAAKADEGMWLPSQAPEIAKQLKAAGHDVRVGRLGVQAGHGLAPHQVAHLQRKVGRALQAARLQVEMAHVEAPARTLATAMLAHQAIQPPLDAAREPEIRRVDG